MTVYATLDSDENGIFENADIDAFDTREEAETYLKAHCEDFLYDRSSQIEIKEGRFDSYWIKTHDYPVVTFEPFEFEDLIIRHPGQHPGGNCYWIEPRPTILVAEIKTL